MSLLCYLFTALLAAVIVTTASATVVAAVAAVAAAEENEDKDDYPAAVISTEITHSKNPLFVFSSHTMPKRVNVLLGFS